MSTDVKNKLIFIISPLKGQEGDPGWPLRSYDDPVPGVPIDIAASRAFHANRSFAERLCASVAKAGGIPFAPHVYCTHFLDDSIPEERNLGIDIGLHYLARADEVWVVLPSWRTDYSSGMKYEIASAQQLGKLIRYFASIREMDAYLARAA